VEEIAGDWNREHETHRNDYGSEPWGIQWGGGGHIDWIKKIVAPHIKGRRVFELGCGGGKWTKVLFDLGAASVTAMDVHPVALQDAKAYEPRAEYMLGDGENLGLDPNSYDLVFTYDVLLHLPPGLVYRYLEQAAQAAPEVIFQLPILELVTARNVFRERARSGSYRSPYSLGYFNFYTQSYAVWIAGLAGLFLTTLGNNERDAIWLGRRLQG
jgi:SAM-dependent methyltransferase